MQHTPENVTGSCHVSQAMYPSQNGGGKLIAGIVCVSGRDFGKVGEVGKVGKPPPGSCDTTRCRRGTCRGRCDFRMSLQQVERVRGACHSSVYALQMNRSRLRDSVFGHTGGWCERSKGKAAVPRAVGDRITAYCAPQERQHWRRSVEKNVAARGPVR